MLATLLLIKAAAQVQAVTVQKVRQHHVLVVNTPASFKTEQIS